MYDVAIVGAGAAGISAAHACKSRGLSCIVLEADSKIGGRASTVYAPNGSAFDLGAHWLHSPGLNPLSHLVKSGSAMEPLAAAYSRGGTLLAPSEVERCGFEIEECFAAVTARGNSGVDESAQVSLDSAFTIAFTNKQGVAPGQASSVDFARYVWEGEDIPVTQGMGTLVAGLASGLEIRCNHPVETVDLRQADHIRASGRWGSIEARKIVVTVSTGVLQAGTLRFLPELPALHREAIAGLPMGSCNKLRLSFTSRVFDDLPASLLVPLDDPDEAMEIALRENGDEAAIGMFHGSFGRILAGEGEAAMSDHLVRTLAKIFGSSIGKSVSPVPMSVDWDRNPFVRGYVSAALPGCADARANLAEPIENRLAFAGEATSLRFMGDVHGAWLEGEAAVARLHGGT